MSNVASERVVNGIKTRVLHGKDYVEVQERVRIAHGSEHQFEQEATEHFSIGDRWFVRCVIRVDDKKFIGTAEIKFLAPKNTPDGTNPFECAETSALGRALAFAGLGTVESIASFDEVYRVNAIELAEMGGRPVIEAGPPAQLPAPQPAKNEHAEKIGALLSEAFGNNKERRFQAMREAWSIPSGPLPERDKYDTDHVARLDLYIAHQKASAGAGR